MKLNAAARLATYGATSCFLLLMLAIVIKPGGLAANDGLSYYGGFLITAIPYTLGLLICAFFVWRAAETFDSKKFGHHLVALSLRLMSVLLVGLFLTPHQIVNSIHTAFGAALFVVQLLLTIWLVFAKMSDFASICLLATEFIGGLAAFVYLPGAHGFLLQSQIVFQIAAWILIIRALDKLGR